VVRLLLEDGGIGILQGDSGTGKTEAVRAVALRHERAIVVQSSKPPPAWGARAGICADGANSAVCRIINAGATLWRRAKSAG